MKKIIQILALMLFGGLLILSCNNIFSCSSSSSSSGIRWTPESGKAPQPGDEYENPMDGYVLVWIPRGEFWMGSESGDDDEKPRYKISVDGFWLGKYEVTLEQYTKFISAPGNEAFYRTPYMDEDSFNSPKQPITALRFYDALAYCEWSELRLPTEAEWEYAASGGKQMDYPTLTGSISHDLSNYSGTGGRDIWLDTTSPVGSFPPNTFGLFDMAGNVWEWTSSLYQPYPYMKHDGREDLNARGLRVMRGGSWEFSEIYCKTTHRHHFEMHLRYDFCGMRLAKSFAIK